VLLRHADAFVCSPYQNSLLCGFSILLIPASSTIPAALSLLSASPPSLDSISDWHSNPIAHRVRRKRQRLPPSLLIENASDRHFSSTRCVLPEAFPIKPSDKPGLEAPCSLPSSDRTGQSTNLLASRSPYCWGNDSHPPPSALYKAIRFVVTTVWLCAKRSSFP